MEDFLMEFCVMLFDRTVHGELSICCIMARTFDPMSHLTTCCWQHYPFICVFNTTMGNSYISYVPQKGRKKLVAITHCIFFRYLKV